MKWSEQMRELLSEDEHYNQLVYDVEANALYINDKLIAITDEGHSISQDAFCDLKKKYPYIDDKNFLLNCLFKLEQETTGYAAPDAPKQIMTGYLHPNLVRYTKSNMGTLIVVELITGDAIYNFTLPKAVIR